MMLNLITLNLIALTRVPAGDRVSSLPGYNGSLPTPQYSGYLPVGNISGSAGMLHYWLIESEGNVDSDPVVLWLNGGPGASGMIGMLTELGPFQTVPAPGACPSPTKAAGSTPTLYHNPYSWASVASLFTIEQPKGVGFSYCDSKPCVNTDESTAQDTYEALVGFFQRFPELAARDFYITGESYAGVYVPMIMQQIMQRGGLPNFKGSAIGNGCWGSECFYGVTESQIDFHTFTGQAMLSPTLGEQISAACGGQWENLTSSNGACGGLGRGTCGKLLRHPPPTSKLERPAAGPWWAGVLLND